MFIVPVTRTLARTNGHPRDFGALFDRLFDDAFFTGVRQSTVAPRSPALDVSETDAAYTVTVDLPGVAKEDVKVSIDGRRVSIEAQSTSANKPADQPEGATAEPADAKASERIVLRERTVARFARSFTLPREVDQAASQAKLDNGVLSLVLAKKVKPAAATLAIN